MSCLIKILGIIKHPKHHNQTLTNSNGSSFFNVNYESCFFCLSPHFSSLLFLFFSFLYIFIYGPSTFCYIFFPLCFYSPVSRIAWLQWFTYCKGSNKKFKVMAGHLLHRCKHFV